jgi:hypothetical protein
MVILCTWRSREKSMKRAFANVVLSRIRMVLRVQNSSHPHIHEKVVNVFAEVVLDFPVSCMRYNGAHRGLTAVLHSPNEQRKGWVRRSPLLQGRHLPSPAAIRSHDSIAPRKPRTEHVSKTFLGVPHGRNIEVHASCHTEVQVRAER